MKKKLLLFSFVLICSALYAQDLIVTDNRDSINNYTPPQKKAEYAHFRMAVAGGYSYLMDAPSNPSIVLYPTEHGFHYGVELNYYFNKNLGIGINYYAAHFGLEDDYNSDNIYIQQLIPTFSTRMFDKKKRGALLVNVGVGYVVYKYNYSSWYPGSTSKIKPATFRDMGILCSIGYDFPFSKTMAVFPQLSITSGPSNEINSNYGLGKINLSLGLRFAK
ncbi:MAG: hypothetical protein FWG84_07340 [Bacteroidales bacterium]|nr:hypothetical protein [Bacteroidales bacterium]